MRIPLAIAAIVLSTGTALSQAERQLAPAEIMPPATIDEHDVVALGHAKVMTYGDVLHQWDGMGEVLLVPNKAWAAGIARSLAQFTIGISFSNEGVAADTVAECPENASEALIAGGALRITIPRLDRPHAAITLSSRLSNDGAYEQIFAAGRCGYVLRSAVFRLQDGAWQDAGTKMHAANPGRPSPMPPASSTPPRPSPPSPISPLPPSLASGDEYFGLNALTFSIVGPADGAVAADCPRDSGLLVFGQGGIHVRMPWLAQNGFVTPGLSLDREQQVGTLIFQNGTCRMEVQVTREIEHDGVWQRSQLSGLPRNDRPPSETEDKTSAGGLY